MAAFRVFEPAGHFPPANPPLTKISSSSSIIAPRPSIGLPPHHPWAPTGQAVWHAPASSSGFVLRTLFSLALCRKPLSLSLHFFSHPAINHPTKCRTSALPARIICIWSVLRHHNNVRLRSPTVFTHTTSLTHDPPSQTKFQMCVPLHATNSFIAESTIRAFFFHVLHTTTSRTHSNHTRHISFFTLDVKRDESPPSHPSLHYYDVPSHLPPATCTHLEPCTSSMC